MTEDNDRNYLLWLLGRRDYSRGQLERKLKLRGVSKERIATILDGLIEAGLFRPEAFAKIRTRILIRRGYSRGVLRAKLGSERLVATTENIEDGFQQLNLTEESQIRELLRKAHKRLSRAGKISIRDKVIQSVIKKGHAYTQVRKIYDEETWETA